jgi:hypothetical protein
MKKLFAPLFAALVVMAAGGAALAASDGQVTTDQSAKHPEAPAAQGQAPHPGPNPSATSPSPTAPSTSSPSAAAPSTTSPSATYPPASSPSTTMGTPGTENTEEIRQAQSQLQAAGFTPGPATGIMDERTREAIRQFQQAKGLNATGELDQDTRSALLSGSASGTPPSSNK